MAPSRGTPGMLVAGRYQLVDALGDPRAPGPLPRWQARDTLLQRPVVLSLVPEGPLAEPTLQAARAAAQLTTGALVRVLDVLDLRDAPATARPPHAAGALVTEWVEGESLEALLVREGPLPDASACAVGLAAGEVLSDIARTCPAELGDLLLRPADVILSGDGRVAVALDRNCPPRHTAAGPSEQVAALVYAALTARWPGDDENPFSGELTTGTLRTRTSNGHSSAQDAPDGRGDDELADSAEGRVGASSRAAVGGGADLASGARSSGRAAPRAARVSVLPAPPHGPHHGAPHHVRAGIDGGLDAAVARVLRGDRRVPLADLLEDLRDLDLGAPPEPAGLSTPPRVLSRAVPVAVGLVLALGLGLLAWQSADSTGQSDVGGVPARPRLLPPSPSSSPPATAARLAAPVDLRVRAVRTLDPYGDGHEHDELARAVIDGNTDTAWRTATYYRRPDFGGLKSGVGLLLDLGASERVATVTVDSTAAGGSFDVYASGDPLASPPPAAPLAHVDAEQDTERLDLTGHDVTARWLLLWWRELPPAADAPDAYRLQVSEIRVTGWPGGQQ